MPRRIAIAVVVAVVVTACGRFSFEAVERNDAAIDAELDAPDSCSDCGSMTTGLVVWYPMDDDPSSGTVVDMSPNHLDAVCAPGECPRTASGMLGGALEFDGSGQRLTTVDDGRLQQTMGFTVTLWVMRSAAGVSTVLAKPLASGPGASWELAVTDAETRFYNTNGTVEDWIMSDGPMPLDTWVHVAISWDGTIKRLYLDGTELASGTKATVFDATPLQLGADQEDGVAMLYFHGRLDEVRIYDHALTLAEIRQIHDLR